MAEAIAERRATRRFALQLPVVVEREDTAGSLHLQSRDVSAGGISFYSETPMAKYSAIHFMMTLPPEITQTEGINIRCHGRIVRVERDGTGLCIAAAIERYEFLGGGT